MIQEYDSRSIRDSGLFDPDWYRREYPDVQSLGMDPFEHYTSIGHLLNRNPGPGFNARYYLEENSDVLTAGASPLLHYIQVGRSEGRSPLPPDDGTAPPFSNVATATFSVIMPTRDRANCIGAAIDSLLNQTHQLFELIIVDDGSTDGTQQMVQEKYAESIQSGRIVYVRCSKPGGVCMARNIGLSKAQHDWIAYLDSDNTVRPHFLQTFGAAIASHPSDSTFYANFEILGSGRIGGRPFDPIALAENNYIDIGVFCHRRSLYKELGGFDPTLARLVDWELILRYTKAYPPIHIPYQLMDYNNRESDDRISRKESFSKAKIQVHRKHKVKSTVSVVVLTYNQQDHIMNALKSVMKQTGDFTMEVLVSDDGSTDRTPELVEKFCANNQSISRNLSQPFNFGISSNFHRCFFESSGEYVAVLEGDDYWEASNNLAKKIAFMRENSDCSMVFSKLRMIYSENGTKVTRFLERQERLSKSKLTGQDFLDDPHMNLIVNFSSCLFKTELMKALPYQAYRHRLSEITAAFFLEQFGPIGYINEPLTAYNHHGNGAWSGLSEKGRVRDAATLRSVVKSVAAPQYREAIEAVIQEKYLKRLKELEAT